MVRHNPSVPTFFFSFTSNPSPKKPKNLKPNTLFFFFQQILDTYPKNLILEAMQVLLGAATLFFYCCRRVATLGSQDLGSRDGQTQSGFLENRTSSLIELKSGSQEFPVLVPLIVLSGLEFFFSYCYYYFSAGWFLLLFFSLGTATLLLLLLLFFSHTVIITFLPRLGFQDQRKPSAKQKTRGRRGSNLCSFLKKTHSFVCPSVRADSAIENASQWSIIDRADSTVENASRTPNH
jgi:hypothetical protein